MASVTYFPNTNRNAKTKFYMVGYVGAYDILQQLEIGVNTFQNNNWHFGLAPEIGIYYQAGRTTNLTLSEDIIMLLIPVTGSTEILIIISHG